ncbi:hypothetical protein QFC22_002219 [Naganishia vaughanmartiniae]|uniref:Uncharacterized protein n=1 Tax=Naganishia vaughanmartiniae TaxID=1424756 RepID=A0ACC2XC20_9TREE|nr:hypothetical protein QFC22_002219 [Naganishia vaughanmartiniae]
MTAPSIDQDAILTLLCNQTIANIAFLQNQSVIPRSAALDSVQNDLQNVLNEINARSSFGNLNVSNGNQHRQSPVSVGTSSTTLYPSAGASSASSTAALVPVYSQTPAPPSLPSRSSHERQPDRAVALWDYSGGSNDDLNFAVNDVIIIDEEVNADWYKGHLESNPSTTGFFPSNYIRKEPARPKEPPRFLAPHAQESTNITQSSYQSVPPPHQQVYGQPGPSGGYQPYPNQQHQGGYNVPPPPPHHSPQDQLALAPVPYTQGGMTTTAVTPGGMNAVVTNTETGKQSKFKLKPGSMKSTVRRHFIDLAHSAVGGLGFGAGASLMSEAVHGSKLNTPPRNGQA